MQNIHILYEGPAPFVITGPKYKVIAVMATEVEHIVMRTLEHLYAYFYVK